MKQLTRILICVGILMSAINVGNAQSNIADQQNDPPTTKSDAAVQQQTDQVSPQTVTIAGMENANAVQPATTSYRATEKIRVYSGSQTGNNLVKTIEVPLPENSPSVSEVYVPH